jgi:phytoene dehydrogenase-like protein/ferredoxin-NADP reductase
VTAIGAVPKGQKRAKLTTDVDAVVIGAGNAGLTAAATLAQGGARTLLLERHNVPGGCATSFCRGRFEFEVALHQLSGLGTDEHPLEIHDLLRQLGVLDRLAFIHEPDLYRVTIPSFLDVTLPANRAGVVEVLAAEHPDEVHAVERFLELVHSVFTEWIDFVYLGGAQRGNIPVSETHPILTRYALRSLREVLDELFVSQTVKTVLGAYCGYLGQAPANLAFLEFAKMLEMYLEAGPAHIKGGSQALSNAILDQFLHDGGQARFNCGADAILTKNGRVRGVRTEAGDIVSCRVVISNASIPVTYGRLLDIDPPEAVRHDLASRPVGVSAFIVYLGLNAPPQELGITTSTNFSLAGFDHDRLGARHDEIGEPRASVLTCYSLEDPSFSPPGTSHVSLVDLHYSEPWTRLSPSEYFDAKFRYADKLVGFAERTFPGLRDAIEEADAATPLTLMRYLGHPGGAIYGFDQTPSESDLFRYNDSGISGLHLAGAWVTTGGFEPTLAAGAAAGRAALTTIDSTGSGPVGDTMTDRSRYHGIDWYTSIATAISEASPMPAQLIRADETETVVARLHPHRLSLEVAEVITETPTAVTLRMVSTGPDLPHFLAGQYINVFVDLGATRTSRPYSISSAPSERDHYDLTIREFPDGLVSPYLTHHVRTGDRFTTTGPMGNFFHNPLFHGDHLVFLAGGSGVAPARSMARDITQRGSPLYLHIIYGSKNPRDIIFRDELDTLGRAHDTIDVTHIISEPDDAWDGRRGFIETELIAELTGESLHETTFYLSGPQAMYSFCLDALRRLGVARRQVRYEANGPPLAPDQLADWPDGLSPTTTVTITVNGEGKFCASTGEPLLSSLERAGYQLEVGCRSGYCSLCRIKILDGTVVNGPDARIRRSDLWTGHTHACVAFPITDLMIQI